MTDMIEKAGKAIFIERYGPHGFDTWESISESERQSHRDMARAAIGAIREPDEGTLETFDYYEKREDDTHVEGSWQDAMDHILKGETE